MRILLLIFAIFIAHVGCERGSKSQTQGIDPPPAACEEGSDEVLLLTGVLSTAPGNAVKFTNSTSAVCSAPPFEGQEVSEGCSAMMELSAGRISIQAQPAKGQRLLKWRKGPKTLGHCPQTCLDQNGSQVGDCVINGEDLAAGSDFFYCVGEFSAEDQEEKPETDIFLGSCILATDGVYDKSYQCHEFYTHPGRTKENLKEACEKQYKDVDAITASFSNAKCPQTAMNGVPLFYEGAFDNSQHKKSFSYIKTEK